MTIHDRPGFKQVSFWFNNPGGEIPDAVHLHLASLFEDWFPEADKTFWDRFNQTLEISFKHKTTLITQLFYAWRYYYCLIKKGTQTYLFFRCVSIVDKDYDFYTLFSQLQHCPEALTIIDCLECNLPSFSMRTLSLPAYQSEPAIWEVKGVYKPIPKMPFSITSSTSMTTSAMYTTPASNTYFYQPVKGVAGINLNGCIAIFDRRSIHYLKQQPYGMGFTFKEDRPLSLFDVRKRVEDAGSRFDYQP